MLEIKNTTRSKIAAPSRAFFIRATQAAFPESYELSLVVCADHLAKRLNNKYRNKSYTANVLAFPLSSSAGEIFLNIRKAEREAASFDRNPTEHTKRLFIHALAHLRGYDHSPAMEALELKLYSKAT